MPHFAGSFTWPAELVQLIPNATTWWSPSAVLLPDGRVLYVVSDGLSGNTGSLWYGYAASRSAFFNQNNSVPSMSKLTTVRSDRMNRPVATAFLAPNGNLYILVSMVRTDTSDNARQSLYVSAADEGNNDFSLVQDFELVDTTDTDQLNVSMSERQMGVPEFIDIGGGTIRWTWTGHTFSTLVGAIRQRSRVWRTDNEGTTIVSAASMGNSNEQDHVGRNLSKFGSNYFAAWSTAGQDGLETHLPHATVNASSWVDAVYNPTTEHYINPVLADDDYLYLWWERVGSNMQIRRNSDPLGNPGSGNWTVVQSYDFQVSSRDHALFDLSRPGETVPAYVLLERGKLYVASFGERTAWMIGSTAIGEVHPVPV